ncbi:MAG: N-acetylmuramoyl-L-alanine amidase [Bacteroidetes bacterium]|nr:MAG: N-acetylmuramoyl-L-alanine amidase [Bacteroidota bacterium]
MNFMLKILLIFFNLFAFCGFAQEKNIILVVDAGHGGYDPGTERSHKKFKHEKDIVLAISLKINKILENQYDKLEIIYTRQKDVFVSLEDRVFIANDKPADFFVSLHCNSNPNSSISGVQIHIHHESFSKSELLAKTIEKELTEKAKRISRGILNYKDRDQHLFVLQNTKMSSVLVEMGFLSNSEEEKYLNSEAGQQEIAEAIASGMVKYAEKIGLKTKASKSGKKVFKVQIKASDKKMALDHKFFEKLKMEVEESFSSKEDDILPYKYSVGNS